MQSFGIYLASTRHKELLRFKIGGLVRLNWQTNGCEEVSEAEQDSEDAELRVEPRLERVGRTMKMQRFVVLFLTGMRLKMRLPRLTSMKKVKLCIISWRRRGTCGLS